MARVATITGDMHVTGQISAGTLVPSNNTVRGAHITSTPADAIPASKVQQQFRYTTNFGLASSGTAVAREEIAAVARHTVGTLTEFGCALDGATTTGTVSFDLKVGGATVLSATVDFTSADASGVVKTGTISSASLTTDDIIEIEITVTGTPDGTGPVAWVEFTEDAE